ncbi:MAG: 4Fe-4S binding protein [Endomicrobium sp.]|jgi:carbon-monoxide dehydrogenase iron sulfur subunit|nr:4Fe-4S binding protein [Endomicrobium sp.]
MKRIYSFENRCLGCKLCEIYCKVSHSKSKNVIKANKLENVVSKIIVEKTIDDDNNISHFALQCRHCEAPKCIKACISGAMYKDDNGIVRNNEKKCIGCLSCILACPFGAIKKNNFDKVTKCDLCIDSGNDEPFCVKNCPNEAIKFLSKGK